MPSTKDPNLVVNPGPGRLPEGSVPASALLFVAGGGGASDAALLAHITDPTDAHMAGAIGIPSVDPVTGEPLLSVLDGGAYDGESVLDALRMLKDLIPPRPDRVGFENSAVPNSGVPSWGDLDAIIGGGFAITGGWTDGSTFVPSDCIVPNTVTTAAINGVVYPADRGILAIYYCTDGTFSGGTTSLFAAISLGTTAIAGIPNAAFNEATRDTSQINYTAAVSGIDRINLTKRLPYKSSYSPGEYTAFTKDFYAFQLATYGATVSVPVDKAGSYLIVHWRETYATSLAIISSFLTANLSSTNCYSAVPSGGIYDAGNVRTLTKHNIFRDSNSAVAPSGSTATSAVAGTTVTISGVAHYTTDITFTLQVNANALFSKAYNTGTVVSPPDVPTGFASAVDPIQIDLTDFGVTAPVGKHYYELKDAGSAFFNSTSNVPLAADTAQLGPVASFAIPALPALTYATPTAGFAVVRAFLNKDFTVATVTDTKKYMYNGYPQTGATTVSTKTLEKFTDERFRVDPLYVPTSSDLLPPTGGADYNSATVLAIQTGGSTTAKVSLQTLGGRIIYPQTDFSVAAFAPTGPDYNAVFLGDALNARRVYTRAFNTGIPRSTGRLRIKGLTLTNFRGTGAISPTFADHPGKVVVTLHIPGVTGFLDLGRVKGDPDLQLIDQRGCLTGSVTGGVDGDIFEYDTTLSTADNGAGDHLIYVGITFIKDTAATTPPGGNIVENLYVDEIEWLPPV